VTLKVAVPPIKSQGIKTKLVPWIRELVPSNFKGKWIEPFMGTGVVAFNLAPMKALLCDTNPHLINFYSSIQCGRITPVIVKNFLEQEGQKLLDEGEKHYYYIRDRFNENKDPLDFLFLNRAGFNGMIRFNRKGGFNIPFCRKPSRFAQAYVTKITNQVTSISKMIAAKDFEFKCQSFEETISCATKNDLIYCDPPYIDRHVDYFGSWDAAHEERLFDSLNESKAKFILSTWHHNDFRSNEYIEKFWNNFDILTREHFYHVGGKEKNRNPMIEAIVTNVQITKLDIKNISSQPQLDLCGS
jgi:DNA adenine methylase